MDIETIITETITSEQCVIENKSDHQSGHLVKGEKNPTQKVMETNILTKTEKPITQRTVC